MIEVALTIVKDFCAILSGQSLESEENIICWSSE